MKILQLLLILIESIDAILRWRKAREFDENVEKIKADPAGYARAKFGRSGVRIETNKKPMPDSETDPGNE